LLPNTTMQVTRALASGITRTRATPPR
jgi:hypothetical protein